MNTIHPTAVIGSSVQLGDDNVVGPFVVIGGNTRIGSGNWIGAHAVLGAPPEVRSLPHESAWIESSSPGLDVGDANVIREGVNIHGGWKAATSVGNNTFVMNQSYIAHDSVLGDDVTLASHVALAGHVRVDRGANLGLGAVVHQGTSVGAYAMVGMASVVRRDVPPFSLCFGSPAKVQRANTVGLERAGFGREVIAWVSNWLDSGAKVDDETLDRVPPRLEAFVRAYAGSVARLA